MPGIVWMGQDTHARWNADWTSSCTAASHACTSAGISGELYQWAAAGISYRVCVVWVKQMQVDCYGVAGCCSKNPSSWKLWAWTTAMDVAEECWSQVAQWLSAQPVLLKRPGGLVLAHFRPPEKPFPLQERFHLHVAPQALTFLDTLHYADCWGVEKTVQWRKISDLQLLEEMVQVQKWETMSKICCWSTAPCSISHQDLKSSLCCC